MRGLHGCVTILTQEERRQMEERNIVQPRVTPSMARHTQEPTEGASHKRPVGRGCTGYMVLKEFGSHKFSGFKLKRIL